MFVARCLTTTSAAWVVGRREVAYRRHNSFIAFALVSRFAKKLPGLDLLDKAEGKGEDAEEREQRIAREKLAAIERAIQAKAQVSRRWQTASGSG